MTAAIISFLFALAVVYLFNWGAHIDDPYEEEYGETNGN